MSFITQKCSSLSIQTSNIITVPILIFLSVILVSLFCNNVSFVYRDEG